MERAKAVGAVAVEMRELLERRVDDEGDHVECWDAMKKCVEALKALDERAAKLVGLVPLKSAVKDMLLAAREFTMDHQEQSLLEGLRVAVEAVGVAVRDVVSQVRDMEAYCGAADDDMGDERASPVERTARQVASIVSRSSVPMLTSWNSLPQEVRSSVYAEVTSVLEKLVAASVAVQQQQQTRSDSPPRNDSPPPPLSPRGRTQTMKEIEARRKMALVSGASTVAELQLLLEGDAAAGGAIHMGGLVGEVTVNKDFSVSDLTRRAVAFIISSNAFVLTKKTSRDAVEATGKAFLSEMHKALKTFQERGTAVDTPSVCLQLAARALQECELVQLGAIQADQYVVADASQQTFGSLLRRLYAQSNHIRVCVVHLLMVIERADATQGTMAHHASALVLQSAALGLLIVELLKELHALVVTARHISSLASAPERKERAMTASTPFWDEVLAAKAAEAALSMEGYLTWQAQKHKSWKRRWFVLKDSVLSCYAVRGAPEPKRRIPIASSGVVASKPDMGWPLWQFTLAQGEETHSFSAETEKERTEWIERIERALAAAAASASATEAATSETKTTPKMGGKPGSKLLKSKAALPNAVVPRASNPTDELLQVTGLPKRGTLNKLVEAITHASHYDHSYMAAFIATYRSFTTPQVLLERLLQRFEVPSSPLLTAQETTAVQQRVPVVLKYWVEVQPDDFDDTALTKLTDFAKSKVAPVQPEVAALLVQAIEKQAHLRKNRRANFEAPPIDFATTSKGQYTAAELLMLMHAHEVARQLTLIDHALYCTIHPTELLSQSWVKASRQHRSPNVIGMVTRLNRIALWVAAVVLWQESEELRSRALCKFVEIAVELRALNNFHTLMGIIAGLNSASCSRTRLRLTWAGVPAQLLASLSELEALMSPQSSWKSYRAAVRSAKMPCLPYLGCYLGDLIGVDEGNPDEVDGMINFEKYLETWRYIREVESYKDVPYAFPQVEPLYTLLIAQPSFSDKDLYEISLLRERRGTTDALEESPLKGGRGAGRMRGTKQGAITAIPSDASPDKKKA